MTSSNHNLSIQIENSLLQCLDDILSPPVNPITGDEIDELPEAPQMMADMTVPELGQILRQLALRTDGNRPVLLCRLRVHIGLRAEQYQASSTETDRQTDGQAGRQAGRETDRMRGNYTPCALCCCTLNLILQSTILINDLMLLFSNSISYQDRLINLADNSRSGKFKSSDLEKY